AGAHRPGETVVALEIAAGEGIAHRRAVGRRRRAGRAARAAGVEAGGVDAHAAAGVEAAHALRRADPALAHRHLAAGGGAGVGAGAAVLRVVEDVDAARAALRGVERAGRGAGVEPARRARAQRRVGAADGEAVAAVIGRRQIA